MYRYKNANESVNFYLSIQRSGAAKSGAARKKFPSTV
jgi:hypothetical protein